MSHLDRSQWQLVDKQKQQSLRHYTPEEVAKHNTLKDVWLIIDDKVTTTIHFAFTVSLNNDSGEVTRSGILREGLLLISSTPLSAPLIGLQVYDVTKFVPDHPGREQAILKWAGKDCTKAFYGDQHPDTVVETVKRYMIGYLKKE